MSGQAGCVYLVGAGPGAPGLLTVRGAELLESADVVVLDRLVGPEIVARIPAQAEVIYAGKSPAGHTLRQEEINAVLVRKAQEGKMVVRLKGGDPFVFGRGGEEAQELVKHGVPFEVVPGITSAIAVPAYAGVPVTHRDFTSAFAVITGHEDPTKEESSIRWPELARWGGTLVFLMGYENLGEIASRLMAEGLAASTPVSVTQWGTLPTQRSVVGTLDDIAEKARQAGLGSPAVLVIGEVASLRDELRWFDKRPLFGKKVLVTRAREQASGLRLLLEEQGAEVVELPAIAIQAIPNNEELDQALADLPSYAWVVFASANAVRVFMERLRELGRDARALAGSRLSVVGTATAEALEGYGLRADLVPAEFAAEGVVEGLSSLGVKGQRVLLPRAETGREVLVTGLEAAGAQVDVVSLYRTVRGEGAAPEVLASLTERPPDIVTFASSSTVRNTVELLGEERRLLDGAAIACIGPSTSATAREMGFTVDVEAEEHTVAGLVAALVEHSSRR